MPDASETDPPLDGGMLDELWDFGDPAASEARFRALLTDAQADTQATQELRTQLARSLGLQGRFDEAAAVLDDVAAVPGAGPALRARLLLERGRLLNSSGRPAAAVPLFRAALETAAPAGQDFLAVDAAHMLAIADAGQADDWTRRGLGIVRASGDARTARWAAALHNNLGWSLHDRGEFADALGEFRSALDAYRATGTETQIRIAEWAVARCLRSLGSYAEALAIQTRLAESPSDGYVDEELGELLLALGRAGGARPYFAAAAERLGADPSFASGQPDRLARLRALGRA